MEQFKDLVTITPWHMVMMLGNLLILTLIVKKLLFERVQKVLDERLAVMDYLRKHKTHPTADDIYVHLLKEIPTLSKTTVYNTLRLLVEHGAARMLTIDERNVCFDAMVEPHAHFLCTTCGRVYDLPTDEVSVAPVGDLPGGHKAVEADLYYRGTCCHCLGGELKN